MHKLYFYNKNSKLVAVIALFLSLTTNPAQAISVTNLDSIPHQLSLSVANKPEVVIIAPNATYRSNYPRLNIRLLDVVGSVEIRAEDFEEYVIWPDGKLIIQKRRDNHNKSIW